MKGELIEVTSSGLDVAGWLGEGKDGRHACFRSGHVEVIVDDDEFPVHSESPLRGRISTRTCAGGQHFTPQTSSVYTSCGVQYAGRPHHAVCSMLADHIMRCAVCWQTAARL